MRSRLFVLASSLALIGATPSLALTISSAPPSRDVAPHLTQSGNAGPSLRDTWAGGGRPQAGANFSGSMRTYGGTDFSFGAVRGTVQATPGEPRWSSPRRNSSAPFLIAPPRR